MPSWICANGHSGSEPPSLPFCPVCGAAWAVPAHAGASSFFPSEPSSDETLSPPPSSRPSFPPPDFADRSGEVFETLQRPGDSSSNPNGSHAATIDPPLAPSSVPPSARLSPAVPSSPVGADAPTVEETLHGLPAPSVASPPGFPHGPVGNGAAGGKATSPLNGPPTAPMPHPSPDTAPAPPGADHTLVRPSAAATAAAPAGHVAASVSGYEILSILGRGGMGVVYKARQVGLNRIVALKMILAGSHASDEELLRFKIEAEAIADLQHPNIVQVYDQGVRDGRPFFSLEYLDGGSLQQRLESSAAASSTRSERESAELVETLRRALDYAHRRGIVHRDIKPANILLSREGTPKITDFGLAKRLQQDEGNTATEAILGTPAYMAPEQAQGKTRQVGPAADIYSLGAVLYDLLTGRPPFRGSSAMDTLHLVQMAEPVPPSRLQKKLSRDLETICLKCLEKAPGRRYESAGALADDLRAFLDDRPIQARPTSTRERIWKWARRRPTAAALAALLVIAPLVVTVVSVAFSARLHRVNRHLEEAGLELEQTNQSLENTNAALQESQANLRTTLDDLKLQQKATLRARSARRTKSATPSRAFCWRSAPPSACC